MFLQTEENRVNNTDMKIVSKIVNTMIVFVAANAYLLAKSGYIKNITEVAVFIAYIAVLVCPVCGVRNIRLARLKRCQKGCEQLYAFLASLTFGIIFQVAVIFMGCIAPVTFTVKDWIFDILLIVAVETCLFWVGIIRVYMASSQIGIKWRVIGAVCGMIPIVNLVVLGKILSVASQEVVFENHKIILNEKRSAEKMCATKYPILMVHGVFFRDFRYFNYWGRIPEELQKNGAVIYYGNHQSASSVKDSGQEIAERIKEIVEETGCGKVNIIAHSKGGLDSRYAISKLGMDEYVASLTTVNTPHRGCEFADYLLSKIPQAQKDMVAKTYNEALHKLGDDNPDFMAAVTDLTAQACAALNEELEDPEGVYIQSIGSCMRKSSGGRFPLNLTHKLVHLFDGENDGLVGYKSFEWGQSYRYITVSGNRGISHGDMIDLNRENFAEFDVREFYVEIVNELKRKGL